ncbi:hypothetical protein BVRB_8g196170 [Beta vulgaris subsp. vulgaris]|nr:hypothetical protein BVRB_8g196170 [Beta vulgaris subsp. vulgaris]
MCLKAGFPLPSLEGLATRTRTYPFRPPRLAVELTRNPQPTVDTRVDGGGVRNKKVCLCSPTRHPGSFRCRYHHRDYVWCTMKQLSPRFQL